MPELPEVESVRRTLEPLIVGHVVERAVLHRRDVLVAPGDPPGGFARQRLAGEPVPVRVRRVELLEGLGVRSIVRKGKQLAIIAEVRGVERALGVQLGMTGHMQFIPRGARLEPAPGQPHEHVHATWRFEHGRMVFADPRRFGTLRVFPDRSALDQHFAALGPDALHITDRELAAALEGSQRPIKAALLDQGVLAGVGNIYADEALFLAQLHPRSPAGTLGAKAIETLAHAVRDVLAKAVAAGGSTIGDYRDAQGNPGAFQSQHSVYDRAGLPCPRCGAPLASETIAQRTSVWCNDCQPEVRPRRTSRR